MSDDVTNLAEVLAEEYVRLPAGTVGGDWQRERATHIAEQIAPLIQEARLIGAAMANTDAIAAYAELVERVEALASEWEPSTKPGVIGWIGNPYSDQLRALIDPEATP